MKFTFIAKYRTIWPVEWLCNALDVSRCGFDGRLTRSPSKRTIKDESLLAAIRRSFLGSERTNGARCVRHYLLAKGIACGLHRKTGEDAVKDAKA